MDFFNFFPSLEKSNEAYFGLDSPLSQDLINYANKLKELIQNVDDTKFKNREFMKMNIIELLPLKVDKPYMVCSDSQIYQ